MGTVAFDTYRFVKHLTESGFTEQQAEALAEEQTAVLNGNLATKADLAKLEVALKADIKVEIAQAKYETIKWTIGIVLAVAALQTTVMLRVLS